MADDTTDNTLDQESLPTAEPHTDTSVNDDPDATTEKHTGFNPTLRDENKRYHLTGMFQNWFLDYASYVILERAVPSIDDGLKPVQRRVLHAMKCIDDGRYNKVANIVGQTMQYHPHGDASIGDALVQLGQKDLLIDTQGNWGNIMTGDGAAAPRYIEARLSKFALETVFNAKTTEWMASYDGRNKEPVTLPVKFPLLLAQGVEGIAVGLNSKILPHNFNEICDAAVSCLKGEDFVLYPDFQTGGSIDVSRYNDGMRGGSVKIRAKISKIDNKTLVITEIPYGTNTNNLIESITHASEKGKIKIRHVDDNTSDEARVIIQLQPNVSSDKTIDALYAFTDCEVSVSLNCCVIEDKTPIFTTVSYLLRTSVEHTKRLLEWELNIELNELQERYFFTSLEKLFIEKRIYKDKEFEDATSREMAIRHIDKRIEPFKKKLIRPVTDEDLLRLLEIKMSRITKFDSKKADDLMASLKGRMDEIENHLADMVGYTIRWYENLKKKYGDRYPRRTELRNFETIVATKVAEANQKLYVNYDEGFIGTGLKKDTFVCNCSDIDDILLFFKDGKYKLVRVAEKLFVGKNILHIAVFRKNDTRTIYNIIYRDGKRGPYYMKRCAVTGITRDKEYDLTCGTEGSRIMYFSANPNGEAEVVRVQLKPVLKLKKLEILKDMSELAVKSRQSRGNLLTKYEVARITLKQQLGSTLGGRQVWFDPDVKRLNYDGRGTYLGEFGNGDEILVINTDGACYTTNFDPQNHYEGDICRIEKYNAEKVWTLALWDATQNYYYAKRFPIEASTKPVNLLGDNKESRLMVLTDHKQPLLRITFGGADQWRESEEFNMIDFIGVKSYKAKGKRLTTYDVADISDISPADPEPEPSDAANSTAASEQDTQQPNSSAESNVTPPATQANKPEPPDVDDIPMEIEAPMPEDSLPADEEGQMFLF